MKPKIATPDQNNALSLIQDVKTTQVSVLTRLRLNASRARDANNEELADALTLQAISLSRQNLVLHRAKQRVFLSQDLSQINQRLLVVVRQVDDAFNAITDAATLLRSAAKIVSLVRRLIEVFI